MAYKLYRTKPLPKPVLTYCQLDSKNKLQWNFNQNTNIFIQENIFEIICEMSPIVLRPQCIKLLLVPGRLGYLTHWSLGEMDVILNAISKHVLLNGTIKSLI